MAELPSISFRKYIRRSDGPAEEPTSTLVLTSAAKNYVDVRVLKPSTPNGQLKDLNWAFAGTSTSTPAEHSTSGALTKPRHTTWVHWVDSETEEEISDEGDMYLQPDGTVLEKGVDGDGSAYEELWEDPEAKVVGKDSGRVSYVLRTEDPGRRTRGMCVRIGEWIQGTLRVGKEFTVVRWQWVGEQDGWKEILAIGNGTIPCESLLEGFKQDGKPALVVGGVVSARDQMTWTCIEAFIW